MPRIQSISVCIARDYCLILHQAPGLGFNFDEKVVRKYALDGAKPWTVFK